MVNVMADDTAVKAQKQENLDKALIRAVKKGDIAAAEKAIKKGADVNACDSYGKSTMHYAIGKADSPEMVDFLIKNGFDISGENGLYWLTWRPDDLNIRKYNPRIVKVFLDHGVDPNMPRKGHFPIENMRWDLNAIQVLVDAGADVNKHFNNTILCRRSGNPVLGHWVYGMVARGMDNRALSLIKMFFSKGLSMDHFSKPGKSLVSIAALKNSFRLANYLIDLGMDINGKDPDGKTLLFHVVEMSSFYSFSDKEKLERICHFIKRGADVNIPDNEGRTPLMRATTKEEIELLVSAGADVNTTDNNGRDVLMHCALLHGHRGGKTAEAAVLALIKAGADASATDPGGSTAAMHSLTPTFGTIDKLNERVDFFSLLFSLDDKAFEHAAAIAEIIPQLGTFSQGEQGVFALAAAALLYPEKNSGLDSVVSKSLANSMKIILSMDSLPGRMAADRLLGVASRGKKGALSLDVKQVKRLISLLLETIESNPAAAVEFIRKRVGTHLQKWVDDGIEGADVLVSRISPLLKSLSSVSGEKCHDDLDMFDTMMF